MELREREDAGLRVRREGALLRLRIARPAARNAFAPETIRALCAQLDAAAADPALRAVVLEGDEQAFCSGLDPDAARRDPRERAALPDPFARVAACPRLVISLVLAPAIAGGVGLCAASDLVVAGPRARFQLPELRWGLTPALVLPWLVRRTGFQPAYALTLTARSLSAREAERIHLVDVLAEDPERSLQTLARRASQLPPEAVAATKAYMAELAGIAGQAERAQLEHQRSFAQPAVRARLAAFADSGRAPWEAP